MKVAASLAAILVVVSCQTPSGSRSSGGVLRYSVKRGPPTDKNATGPRYVVDASIQVRGAEPLSQTMAIYDAKWSVLKMGQVHPRVHDLVITGDGEDAVPEEIDIFSGTLLAFRCRPEKEGRINVDLRIYRVVDGQVVGRERSSLVVADGESKDMPLPW